MKVVAPLFESVEVRHKLWHGFDDYESIHKQEKVTTPNNCVSGGYNHRQADAHNRDDSDEDEDPFGMNQNLTEC